MDGDAAHIHVVLVVPVQLVRHCKGRRGLSSREQDVSYQKGNSMSLPTNLLSAWQSCQAT